MTSCIIPKQKKMDLSTKSTTCFQTTTLQQVDTTSLWDQALWHPLMEVQRLTLLNMDTQSMMPKLYKWQFLDSTQSIKNGVVLQPKPQSREEALGSSQKPTQITNSSTRHMKGLITQIMNTLIDLLKLNWEKMWL